MSQAASRHAGFTLIELSVVLVIIGLLIGGIVVGKDLIEAAHLRQTVTFVEQTRSAINTFKTKFNSIPGDMKSLDVQSFGLSTCGCATGTWTQYQCPCMLHGDGMIDEYVISSVYSLTGVRGEAMLFWRHLTEARLISSSVQTTEIANPYYFSASSCVIPDANTEYNERHMPKAAIGGVFYLGGGWNRVGSSSVFTRAGLNLGEIRFCGSPVAAPGIAHAAGLTPSQAWLIDSKFDDGLAKTASGTESGMITAFSNAVTPPSSFGSIFSNLSQLYVTLPVTTDPNTQQCLYTGEYIGQCGEPAQL